MILRDADGRAVAGRDAEADSARARSIEAAAPAPDSDYWTLASMRHPDRSYQSLVEDLAVVELRMEKEIGDPADVTHARGRANPERLGEHDTELSEDARDADDRHGGAPDESGHQLPEGQASVSAWEPIRDQLRDLLPKDSDADVAAAKRRILGPEIDVTPEGLHDAARQAHNLRDRHEAANRSQRFDKHGELEPEERWNAEGEPLGREFEDLNERVAQTSGASAPEKDALSPYFKLVNDADTDAEGMERLEYFIHKLADMDEPEALRNAIAARDELLGRKGKPGEHRDVEEVMRELDEKRLKRVDVGSPEHGDKSIAELAALDDELRAAEREASELWQDRQEIVMERTNDNLEDPEVQAEYLEALDDIDTRMAAVGHRIVEAEAELAKIEQEIDFRGEHARAAFELGGDPERIGIHLAGAGADYDDAMAAVARAIYEDRQLKPELIAEARDAAARMEELLGAARAAGMKVPPPPVGGRILDPDVPEDEFLEDLLAAAPAFRQPDLSEMTRHPTALFEEYIEDFDGEEREWLEAMNAELRMELEAEDLPGEDPDVDERAEWAEELDRVEDELMEMQSRHGLIFQDSVDAFGDDPDLFLKYNGLLLRRDALRDLERGQAEHGPLPDRSRRKAERPLRARAATLRATAEGVDTTVEADAVAARALEIEARRLEQEIEDAAVEGREPRLHVGPGALDRVTYVAGMERVLMLREASESPDLGHTEREVLSARIEEARMEAEEALARARLTVDEPMPEAYRLKQFEPDQKAMLRARGARAEAEFRRVSQRLRELDEKEHAGRLTAAELQEERLLRPIKATLLREAHDLREVMDEIPSVIREVLETSMPSMVEALDAAASTAKATEQSVQRARLAQRRTVVERERAEIKQRIADLRELIDSGAEGTLRFQIEARRLELHFNAYDAELEDLAAARAGEAPASFPWVADPIKDVFEDKNHTIGGQPVTKSRLTELPTTKGGNHQPDVLEVRGTAGIEQRWTGGQGKTMRPPRVVPPEPSPVVKGAAPPSTPPPPSRGGGGGGTPPDAGTPDADAAGNPFPEPWDHPFVWTEAAGPRWAGTPFSLASAREVLGEDFKGQFVGLQKDETDMWNYLSAPTSGEGRRSLAEFFDGELGGTRWRDQARELEHQTTMRRQADMIVGAHGLRDPEGGIRRWEDEAAANADAPAGYVALPHKARGTDEAGGDWIVVPKGIQSYVDYWLRGGGRGERAAGYLTRLAVRASLPFSTMWHLGNVVDNYTRLALTTTPAQWAAGDLVGLLEKETATLDPRLAEELIAPIARGHQGARDMTTQARLGDVWAGKQPQLGREPTKRQRRRAEQGERLKELTERFVRDDVLSLPSLVSFTTSRLFDLTARMESQAHRKVASAQIASWVQEMGWHMDDWTQTMKRAASEISERPQLMLELQRRVLEVLGDYATRQPGDRLALTGMDPFWRWFKAANKFVFLTLPAEHPMATSMLLLASQMTRDERRKMGLDYYLSEDEARRYAVLLGGDYEQVNGFLTGGLPVGEQFVPAMPLSSMGEAAAEIGDPTRIPGRIGGFFAKPAGALMGNWNSPGEIAARKLAGMPPSPMNEKGVDRERRAASLMTEPFIKGAKQFRQVGEGGERPSAHSTWWDPQPQHGSTPSAAEGWVEGVLGVGPREREFKPLTIAEELARGAAHTGRAREVTYTDPVTGKTMRWVEEGR